LNIFPQAGNCISEFKERCNYTNKHANNYAPDISVKIYADAIAKTINYCPIVLIFYCLAQQ
jgi:hypothetical protein